MSQNTIETTTEKPTDKNQKLFLSLLLDGIGMISYSVPVFGEFSDLIWAPLSGILLLLMYKGTAGKVAALFGTVEEMIPLTDVIPTFTLTWFYTYIIKKGEGQ